MTKLKVVVSVTGADRVLGNFKRFEFNLPKISDNISRDIAVRIARRAREKLLRASYKRHYPGLIEGTNALQHGEKGKWTALSEAFDERGFDYGPAVEYGTKPHFIPNNPFWGSGKFTFKGKGGQRQHPGAHGTGARATKGYFRKSLDQTKQELKGIAKEKVNRGLMESGLK